jgi:hypothetical protein
MKHRQKTQKGKKSSRRSFRRWKTTKASKRHKKRQIQAKWQRIAKKSSEEEEKIKLKANAQNAKKLKINTPPEINSP